MLTRLLISSLLMGASATCAWADRLGDLSATTSALAAPSETGYAAAFNQIHLKQKITV